jgi:hypothetical protein
MTMQEVDLLAAWHGDLPETIRNSIELCHQLHHGVVVPEQMSNSSSQDN